MATEEVGFKGSVEGRVRGQLPDAARQCVPEGGSTDGEAAVSISVVGAVHLQPADVAAGAQGSATRMSWATVSWDVPYLLRDCYTTVTTKLLNGLGEENHGEWETSKWMNIRPTQRTQI